jgi:BTB/POZ domain-containing protein
MTKGLSVGASCSRRHVSMKEWYVFGFFVHLPQFPLHGFQLSFLIVIWNLYIMANNSDHRHLLRLMGILDAISKLVRSFWCHNSSTDDYINSGQKQGAFTDFTLTCKGKDIPVHKIIVFSQSKVLRAACVSPSKVSAVQCQQERNQFNNA